MTAPLALRRELTRKAIHLLGAAAPIAYTVGFSRAALLWILGVGSVIAAAVEIGRGVSDRLQRTLDRSVGHLFRPHEHASITGATWLIVGMLAAVAMLPRPLAIATMWAATVGDPAATLAGRTLGRVRLHPDGKSVEGSLTCLATTAVGASLLADLPLLWSIAAGLAAAVGEWPRGPLDDNVRITVSVGVVLIALRMFAA